MKLLIGLAFKEMFMKKNEDHSNAENIPRRVAWKSRECANKFHRVVYRIGKCIYSSVFFYYWPFIAFFLSSTFAVLRETQKWKDYQKVYGCKKY